MEDQDRLLTTDEVAERFRTSPGTVRYWRHIGAGPVGTKIGRRVLYRKSRVEAYLAERERAEEQTA